ncbi:uncharacterized protein PgNI_01323 [Pyricularia grisea]|uniref:Uncharacterized protein n=1 Tax=Pyricularia grisea TaxID=148305 RepID=A0A6P8BKQ2_PYRGI|nr:uncharacterized protein PgNI_01323 [Pyricularia grisea]TLD17269.1 hypothetical protein PgNI_01323 [Pyricularia grisea]
MTRGRQPLDWKSPEVRPNCCPICRAPGVPVEGVSKNRARKKTGASKLGLLGCAKRPPTVQPCSTW